MSDALLQRVGISADKFIYIMNPDEQEWLLLREKLIWAVENGNREQALPLLKEYNKMTAKKCKLHRQFSDLCEVMLEWKNGMHTQAMLDKLVVAWQVTMGAIPMEELATNPLSMTECVIRMLYCRILDDMGDSGQAAKGYNQLLDYIGARMDEEDRVKLYPQIAYWLMEYYLGERKFQKAVTVADKAVEVLKARHRLFYMREFLQVLLKYGQKSEEECVIFQKACDALKWLYEIYQKGEEWDWHIPFGQPEVELCGSVVRARRKAIGMSQEKLAEGICDVVTVSRIERGKVAPKAQILQKIMERIGMKEGCFEAVNQVERPELFGLTDRISVLLCLSKGEEAETLIKELEQKTEKADKFARQYIEYVKALALLGQCKISVEEHYKRQDAALHLTMPYMEKEQQKEWRFSRQEVKIANALSYSCVEVGKTEEVLELLYDIKAQYEKKPFDLLHYITGYELTLRNLGKLLGSIGEYKKAVETARQGISLGVKAGRGQVLGMLLHDCSQDIKQLWQTKEYAKEESISYAKASTALNLLFYGETQSTFF